MDNEHRPDFGEGAAAGMGPARGLLQRHFGRKDMTCWQS